MTEQQTAERIARIETNLERIAVVLEKTMEDHESRLRTLEHNEQRITGVIKLVAWLGAPTTAALVLFLANKA